MAGLPRSSLVTLAVQAGGQSRRMGGDKSLMPFLGQPLIQRVIARGRLFTDQILITANDPLKYAFLNLPVYFDLVANAGPLAGLYSSLRAAATPFVAVVGCDMPFVNPALLAFQLERTIATGSDVAIPRNADGLEPLHAVLRRDTCLAAVQAALDQGNLRLVGWLKDVKTLEITLEEQRPFDPDSLAFMNVNSPEEFRQAEEIALARGL